MKLVLWVLCILMVCLLLEIIWLNQSFSKMFEKGITFKNKKENISDVIDYKVNAKYSHIKIYNLFILSIGYLIATTGMDVVHNYAGTNSDIYLRIASLFSLVAIVFSIVIIEFQKRYFGQIVYKLLTAARSDEKYIEEVIKYRRDTYLGIAAQTLIGMLLIVWFFLESVFPEFVIQYPFPKLSIIVVFGYILQYFIIDSKLDAIYWKYYNIDFRKFINNVFKK